MLIDVLLLQPQPKRADVADVLQHGMVVDKQCGYETFIKPALMINNIAMFAQMYVTYNYCTAAYTIAMAVCAVQSECFGTSSGTRGRMKTGKKS